LLGDKVAEMESRYQRVVTETIFRDREDGYPVALYDKVKMCPYLEHPDGRREYTDE